MSEEINAVIDKLCDKLGTSASLLIPELAKLKTIECAVRAGFFLVILIFGLHYLPKAWRYDHRKNNYDYSFMTALPASIVLIGIIGVMLYTVGLVGWIISPTAKAILMFMDMAK